MLGTFVAIGDPLHRMLRELTRRTPLVPRRHATGQTTLEYRATRQPRPEVQPQPATNHPLAAASRRAAELARWRVSVIGKSEILGRLGHFDIVKVDRRCCRDLRLKNDSAAPGMVAAGLLAFGAGTLRARNDNPQEPLHSYLRERYGRLQSRHEVVFGRLRTLHCRSDSELRIVEKESFDSTNLIYGDAYGEIEQLWERRADIAFLDLVAGSLQGIRLRGHLAGFVYPPLHLSALLELHLRAQPLWKSPPATGRALLRRVEYILDHTVVDSLPQTLIARPRRPIQLPPMPAKEWESDPSGYEGWMGFDRGQ